MFSVEYNKKSVKKLLAELKLPVKLEELPQDRLDEVFDRLIDIKFARNDFEQKFNEANVILTSLNIQ